MKIIPGDRNSDPESSEGVGSSPEKEQKSSLSVFGRPVEMQDDLKIVINDPNNVHHHEHTLYSDEHNKLRHESAEELYGSPSSKKQNLAVGTHGLVAVQMESNDIWNKGPLPN